MSVVFWKDGKPHSTNDPKEAKRLDARIQVIDKLLKEMGYEKGYENYEEYINEMVATDFKKYTDFVTKVSELS